MRNLIAASLLLMSSSEAFAESKVLAFSGSTRQESVNKKLVEEAAGMAREMGAKVTVIDLKDYAMPFYDGDIEANQGMPEGAKALRKLMLESDLVLIASPEYNHSVSGVLKNALDWLSRNEEGKPSKDAFKGKRFALMSASPGKGGGARHLAHLKEIIEDVGGTVLSTQVSIPNAFSAFDAHGHLVNAQEKAALQKEIREGLGIAAEAQ